MRPSCPLYYSAADILAVFSSSCETEEPLANPCRRPEQRALSAAWTVASALAGSAAACLGQIRSGLVRAWLEPWSRPPLGPAIAAGLDADRHSFIRSGGASSGLPYRPALSSHFALID